MTATTDPYAHVPVPAGAAEVWEWADVGHLSAFRQFSGPKRTVAWRDAEGGYPEESTLYVSGTQLTDGTVEAVGIRIEGIGWEDHLPAAAARDLCNVLAELADELDGWTRR